MASFLCFLLYSKTWQNCLYSLSSPPIKFPSLPFTKTVLVSERSQWLPCHARSPMATSLSASPSVPPQSVTSLATVCLVNSLFSQLLWDRPLLSSTTGPALVPFADGASSSSACWNAMSQLSAGAGDFLPSCGLNAIISYAIDFQNPPCPLESQHGLTNFNVAKTEFWIFTMCLSHLS